MTTQEKENADIGIRLRAAILSSLGGLLIVFIVSAATAYEGMFLPLVAVDIVGLEQFGIIMGTSSIILLVSTPLAGLLADFIGRRKQILIGSILLGLEMMIPVSSVGLIWLGRVGIALGTALYLPSVLAYLLEAAWSRWLLGAMAGLHLMVVLGGITLSVPFAGLIIDAYGLEALLSLRGAITIVGGLLSSLFIFIAFLMSRSYRWPVEWLNANPKPPIQTTVMLGLLALATFVITMLLQIINYYGRFHVLDNLNLPVMSWGIAINMQSIGFMLGYTVCITLGEAIEWLTAHFTRYALGRLIFLLLGMFILFIGMAILIASTTMFTISSSIFLTGLGAGLSGPAAIALIVRYIQNRKWALIMGVYLAITSLTGYAGGWLCTLIIER